MLFKIVATKIYSRIKCHTQMDQLFGMTLMMVYAKTYLHLENHSVPELSVG